MTTVTTHILECQLRFVQECQLILSAVHLRAEIQLTLAKRGVLLSRMWSQKVLVIHGNGYSAKSMEETQNGVPLGDFAWARFPFLSSLLKGSGKTLHSFFQKIPFMQT